MLALVTGASGFLGGRLVDMLLAQGAGVLALARPPSAVHERSGVRVLRMEFGSVPSAGLSAALKPVTHVFHCAGCSTDWAPERDYVQGNVESVRAMLALAREHCPALERFVHVSTTDVYGYPERACSESAPPRDVGLLYNKTKCRGEALAWQAAKSGLPVTVVRPASIYGPGGKAFVTDIAALLRQRSMLLVDGGRARGGFVYVDDVCAGMLRAAVAPEARGEAYNLSSVDGTSWAAYAAALAGALGAPAPWLRMPFAAAMALARVSELPYKAGLRGRPLLTRHAVYLLARDQQYATAKARDQLGWSPRVGLEEGMARSVASLLPSR